MTRNDSTSTRTVPISRRRVLRAAGASLVGVGAGTTSHAAAAAGPPTDAADPVEVNVGFAAPSARAFAFDRATRVVREFGFDAATLRLPTDAVGALADRRDVRYVEANGRVRALAQTLPWGIDRVDADVAHANGVTGNGADVAILDTGIDSDHPDLEANLGEGEAFVACENVDNPCGFCYRDWDDDSGHGTRLASIVAAEDDREGVVGVAPEATLHAVKVLGGNGSGSYSSVAAGLEFVADRGWDVANMSFGGDSGSSLLRDAVEYADDRGVTLVAAAGNRGCADCVLYPAKYPEVVAVSATDANDRLADFSSTGPEIELAAPGADIVTESCSGRDGYESVSGTSVAAPHVAGGAAILRAQGYSDADARQRLRDTAEDVGLASDQQGHGLLDVEAL